MQRAPETTTARAEKQSCLIRSNKAGSLKAKEAITSSMVLTLLHIAALQVKDLEAHETENLACEENQNICCKRNRTNLKETGSHALMEVKSQSQNDQRCVTDEAQRD